LEEEQGMKRFLFVNALVAMVGASTLGIVSGGSAHAAVFTCTGNITGQTINTSVLAGPGCESFGNTTINGNLFTQPGGSVYFAGSNIRIYGKAILSGIGAASTMCGTLVTGNLYISGNAHSVSVGTAACGLATDVNGSLYVENNTATVLVKSLTIELSTYVSGNAAGGAVTVQGNSIGQSFNSLGVLSVTNNMGGGSITGNTVGGNLTASNNTPHYTVSGNTVVNGKCNNEGTHSC
jgi:hypothetical protein